jgi:hypothetical protein
MLTSKQNAALTSEIEKLGMAIAAAEDWSKEYDKDPEGKAKLISQEAKLETGIRTWMRACADRVVTQYVNWPAYNHQLQVQARDNIKAFDYNYVFNDSAFDDEDSAFSAAVHDQILYGITIGGQSGEQIYNKPIGITQTSDFITAAARDRVAALVGKKVQKDGTVVDNPNSSMSVTDTTRAKIQQSIQTSYQLHENQDDATKRLSGTIKDYTRAGTIARTEMVNAYSTGLTSFAHESGATGKEWQDVGATDECADNSAEGIIALDDSFDSGDDQPPAHPNCRCGLRIVYSNEFDPSGDSSTDVTDDGGDDDLSS